MTLHARGTFDVTVTPEDTLGAPGTESDPVTAAIGRFRLTKTWNGDLAGTGVGLMLGAGDPASGSAGYVALEIVDGTLAGRRGTFAFQQLGTMRPTSGQHLDYLIAPGSGTGELIGIEGRLDLTIADDEHRYELSYELPERPAVNET